MDVLQSSLPSWQEKNIPANTNQIMGAFCFILIGIPGFLVNLYVVANAMKAKSRSSFIMLGAAKATCDVYMLSTFLFISVPLSILQMEGPFVHRLKFILGMCLGAAAYALVVASLNRLSASFSTRFYNKAFNQKLTQFLLILCLVIVASLCLFFTCTGVEYYFHKEEMIWYGDPGAAPAQMALDVVSYLVYSCTSFMFIANCITFGKLIRDTDCLYLVDMSFVQLFSKLMPNGFWFSLVCFSLIWMCTLLVDGVVMVIFTRELREPIRTITVTFITGRRKSSVRPLHPHRLSIVSAAFIT